MGDSRLCNLCDGVAAYTCGRCRLVRYCSREHQREDYADHKHHCKNYAVCSSDTLGQYLEATCQIMPGSLIMRENPILIGPKPNSDLVCLGCHSPITKEDFYKCPDCSWPMCSKTCAYADQHIHECDVLAQDKTSVGVPETLGETPRYDLILVLRGLLLKKTNPQAWDVLMSMESHFKVRKEENEPYHNATVRYFSEVCKVENNSDEIHKIRGIMDTNCLLFRNEHNVTLRGIYPQFRLFNHSCIPNIHIINLPSGEIEARSAVNIEKNEPLCICYTGTMEPLWKRQQNLVQVYKFRCQCRRCLDPTELGTFFSSPRCPDCRRSFMVPPGDGSVDSWRCQSCDLKYEFIDVMQEVSEWLYHIKMNDFIAGKDVRKISKEVDKIHDSFNALHYVPYQFTTDLLRNLKDETYHCLKLRQEIWENHLNIFNVLEPGMTRRRGVTLCHLGTATLAMVKAGIQEREIWLPRVPELLTETLQQLKEAETILNLEPEASGERHWLSTTQEAARKVQAFQQAFEEQQESELAC